MRGGYQVLATYPSKSNPGADPYQVRRGGDGVLYCTCRGWVMNKNNRARLHTEPAKCTHTKDYVADRPGTMYGPPGMFAEGASQAPARRGAPSRAPARPAAVAPPVPTQAAGADWRSMLLKERADAKQRGVSTPEAAASAYALELDLGE